MHHKLRRPKSASLSAYTQGPRVDSGRGHPHDPRGHAQPPSPGSRAALFCQPARARRDAARSGATGRVRGAGGEEGPVRAGPPPCRPSLPRPRGPTALPRPPAARFYGNGRAPEQGRHDESEPQQPSGRPHRHGGRFPYSANVPARDAAQQHRVCGRGWPRATETPWCSRDCGSLSDRGQCAGAL